MGNNKTWLNVSCKTVFIYVSGQVQRVRPRGTVTGTISKDTQKDFKLIDTPQTVVEQPEKPSVQTPPSSRSLEPPEPQPKEVPKASVKSIKKELRREIKKKGGTCTNFMNVTQLEDILATLDKGK